MLHRIGSGIALTVIVGLLAIWGIAAEKKTEVKDLPKKVLDAAKSRWPKAEIEEATIEDEKGKVVYELEFEQEDGDDEKEWTATFDADGKLLELEEVIKFSDLPRPVQEGLAKKYPAVKKPFVEKVTKGEGAATKVYYELKFAMEIQIDERGTIIEEEEKPFSGEGEGDE